MFISYLTNVEYEGEKVIRGYGSGMYGVGDVLTRDAMAKIINNSRKALPTLPQGDPSYPDTSVSLVEVVVEDNSDFRVIGYYPDPYMQEDWGDGVLRFVSQELNENGGVDNIGFFTMQLEDDGLPQTQSDCEAMATSIFESLGPATLDSSAVGVINNSSYKGCNIHFEITMDGKQLYIDNVLIRRADIITPFLSDAQVMNVNFSPSASDDMKVALADVLDQFVLELK